MKKDMVRVSIYIERSIWQGIRENAHERWIPIGKYVTELYESNKVREVNKPQVPEKITEVEKPEKVESTSLTGEGLPYPNTKRESKEKVISELGDIERKVKKVVEKIPGIQPASNVFNPQPKGKK